MNFVKHIKNSTVNFLLEQELTNSRYVFLYYNYDDSELFEEYGLDVYDVENTANKIAMDGGVRILRDKNLTGVLVDTEKQRVIGGTWVTDDSDVFSFDIALDKEYQDMRLSHILIKIAIGEYHFLKDVYNDLKIEVDVINPKLARILRDKFGFHVMEVIGKDRVLMSLK